MIKFRGVLYDPMKVTKLVLSKHCHALLGTDNHTLQTGLVVRYFKRGVLVKFDVIH